jgi:hypothetical protein
MKEKLCFSVITQQKRVMRQESDLVTWLYNSVW